VISVGQDDEDNEWNAQQPSDDGAFEKGIFHNLGENKHDSSPEIKGMKSSPNFSDNFIVIRRAKVESHKQDEGADQDQSQQEDLELIASEESETNDHQSLVNDHKEIDSCADSGSCVIRSTLVLEESQGDDNAHTEEDETSNDGEDGMKDMHAAPASDF